ncbi:unnamed protein product, partial [Ectocarpus sp. 4 AP-2014]
PGPSGCRGRREEGSDCGGGGDDADEDRAAVKRIFRDFDNVSELLGLEQGAEENLTSDELWRLASNATKKRFQTLSQDLETRRARLDRSLRDEKRRRPSSKNGAGGKGGRRNGVGNAAAAAAAGGDRAAAVAAAVAAAKSKRVKALSADSHALQDVHQLIDTMLTDWDVKITGDEGPAVDPSPPLSTASSANRRGGAPPPVPAPIPTPAKEPSLSGVGGPSSAAAVTAAAAAGATGAEGRGGGAGVAAAACDGGSGGREGEPSRPTAGGGGGGGGNVSGGGCGGGGGGGGCNSPGDPALGTSPRDSNSSKKDHDSAGRGGGTAAEGRRAEYPTSRNLPHNNNSSSKSRSGS